MLTEPLPMSLFVETCFERKEIKSVTDEWRVETSILQQIILSHFYEMGLFSVTPDLERITRQRIIDFLYASPEILMKVAEAERRERMMARSRRNSAD